MRAAYFQSIGGASGDMALAALLDAGLAQEDLEADLHRLPVPSLRLKVWKDQRGSIHGTRVDVLLPDNDPPQTINSFIGAIRESDFPPSVKEQSIRVFQRLGAAELAVHGGSADHPPTLHELASLDTLADVVGVIAGLHRLGIEAIYASPLVLGSGTMKTLHGTLPVPGPATAHLVTEADVPVDPPPSDPVGELTTPTGAALLTTLASFDVPTLRMERIGYGLGSKDTAHRPNVLGLWLGRHIEEAPTLTLLETNIDDTTPEVLGYVQERLMALGARDVWNTPIQMKKGRPGVLLSVLASAEHEALLVDTILRETSTLGVRTRKVQRYEAEREVIHVETPLGILPVKVKRVEGRALAAMPEYEACRAIARERGLPLQEVYRTAEQAAWQFLS